MEIVNKYCPHTVFVDSDIASFSQENHSNMAHPKVSITAKFAMSPIEHIESLNKLLLHNTKQLACLNYLLAKGVNWWFCCLLTFVFLFCSKQSELALEVLSQAAYSSDLSVFYFSGSTEHYFYVHCFQNNFQTI